MKGKKMNNIDVYWEKTSFDTQSLLIHSLWIDALSYLEKDNASELVLSQHTSMLIVWFHLTSYFTRNEHCKVMFHESSEVASIGKHFVVKEILLVYYNVHDYEHNLP